MLPCLYVFNIQLLGAFLVLFVVCETRQKELIVPGAGCPQKDSGEKINVGIVCSHELCCLGYCIALVVMHMG